MSELYTFMDEVDTTLVRKVLGEAGNSEEEGGEDEAEAAADAGEFTCWGCHSITLHHVMPSTLYPGVRYWSMRLFVNGPCTALGAPTPVLQRRTAARASASAMRTRTAARCTTS